MTSLERGEEWIGTLLNKLIDAKISKKPNDKLKLESEIFKDLIGIRNGITTEEVKGDNYKEGHYFKVTSTFKQNEDKLSTLYRKIFAINKYGVDTGTVELHDTALKRIILEVNDKLPLWHELKDEDTTAAPTPLFKYRSKAAFQKRLITQYSDQYDKEDKHESPELDRIIKVRNDKYPPECVLEVTLRKQLQVRINNETDPQYKSHPSEFLLTGILGMKVKDKLYFDYGIRFVELYMEYLMEGSGYDLLHLPVEFKTDGSYGGMQYETLFFQQFRYVVNLLTLNMHNVQVGLLSEEYRRVSNELLLHILQYPYDMGKQFKKAFTPIGLYYGLDANAMKKQYGTGIYVHKHPFYHVNSAILNDYPYCFSSHTVCEGDKCDGSFKTGVFSNTVQKFIETFFEYTTKHKLSLTAAFVKKRLIPVRPNKGAAEDLIFMRLHIGAGGYSHTHKLADFIPEIEEHYTKNEEFTTTTAVDNEDSLELLKALKDIGRTQTLNLINKHAYPTAEKFRMMLPSFLTSKSAGVAPITLEMKISSGGRDAKVEHIKQSLTSKTAHAALRGENVFNIPFKVTDNKLEIEGGESIYELQTPITYYESLDEDEKLRVRTAGLSVDDLAKMNVSTIGSRATSGYRAIRAIFMVKLHQHLMQCALVQPHVSVTTSRYKENDPPKSLWINEHDYGRSILTTDQDGSDDVWARYVMASGDGRMLLSAADATAWDQNVKNVYLNAFYDGIREAIVSRAIFDKGHYMFKDGKGLTLAQVCEEFMDMQLTSMYIAEYGWEAAIVKVNFLTSGRLDTFMFNSIMNSEINKIINKKLMLLEEPAKYVALTVAGDDVLAIIQTKATRADQIELIKTTTLGTYLNVGHKMSDKKTVTARRQSEVAKRNFYFGHYFRDPNVQFHESEKSDKAENRLTRIRGQASKQFEALRRSIADIELSTMMMRLGVMLMYSFKYLPPRSSHPPKGKAANKKQAKKVVERQQLSVKYYPPYAASIVPTHVSGGVGITFTGVSINEVKFMIEQKMTLVDDALGVVSMIKNTSTKGIQTAFVKHFIEPAKWGIIKGGGSEFVKLVGEPTFTNVNPTDTKPSMEAGMSLTRKALRPEKLSASIDATNALKKVRVEVQESVKYKNAPELLVRSMAESISLRYNRGRKDVDEVIKHLFYIDVDGEIRFVKVVVRTLLGMYPIYSMFVCKVDEDTTADTTISNGVARVVSQPSRAAQMEIYYGPRVGKNATLNLQGANTSLRKFITRSGLPMTAEQLMDNLANSGAMADSTRMSENVTYYLTAVSGDRELAEQYVEDSLDDDFTWEDMLTAVTIAGSMTESFDWAPKTIADRVRITTQLVVPKNISDMIKYTTYMYMLQSTMFFNKYYLSGNAVMVPAYEAVLKQMRSATKRKTDKSVYDNDLITSMADYYERHKESSERYFAMVRDEGFE